MSAVPEKKVAEPPQWQTYKINRTCTDCKDCTGICPTESIFFGHKHWVIDADTCVGCRVCVVVCPVGAIDAIPLDEGVAAKQPACLFEFG